MSSDLNLVQPKETYDSYTFRTWQDILERTFSNISKVIAFTKKGAYQVSSNTTPVGNVGVGEDDLITYLLQANTIADAGYNIDIIANGTFAANANNKRLKLYFGSTLIYDSTALAINGGAWSIRATIIRQTNTTQQANVVMVSSNATLGYNSTYTDTTETLSTDITIKCTGEATSNNDIVQKNLIIRLYPQVT